MLTFFGVVMAQIGYETLRRGSITYTPEVGPAEILSPDHRAATFWGLSAGLFMLGVLLLIIAAYLLVRFFRGMPPGGPNQVSLVVGAFMKRTRLERLGPILNVVFVLLSLWTGYAEMAPDRRVHMNPDAIFCTIVLLGTIGFSFGTVAYSISGAGQQTLRRPSLRRFTVDWWHDPLQCLFLSCGFAAAMALGAAFRLPGTSITGFWTFMFFLCLFLGLLIGQLGVYLVHRERITNT
jgi:hypothetical protein